jgi:hypothetical protein
LISSHKFHNIENYFLYEMLKKKKLGQFSKNYRTFCPKNWHKALKNMGLGSGIRDLEKPYSGSRGSKRHRIRIRKTVNNYGTRGSGKRLGCIDVSTGVVTTGPAANQVVQHSEEPDQKIHCKKSLAVFPSPAGMSLTNNLIIPVQGEFG